MVIDNRLRWQFSLRHLFELTTLSAIGAAVAATCGAGTLVTSVGIILAWLNMHGAFERIQSGRKQAAILVLSWITFLISLALPSFTVFGPVQGYSAAWFAIVGPVESFLNDRQLPIGVIVYLVIDVANVLMLLLPLLIWRLRRSRGQMLGTSLSITMVGPWCIAWDSGELLFGYYLWCVSFGMALIAIRIRGWIFSVMLAMAGTLAAIVLLGR